MFPGYRGDGIGPATECSADDSGLLHSSAGRINQVKIRGFRVELEEVEGEIARMPA